MESAGEIHQYWDHIAAGANCTCGRKINDCSQWKVVKNFVVQYRGIYLNDKNLKLSKTLANKEEEQVHNNLETWFLYRAILKSTGKDILIDSSKTPERLRRLYDSGLFNIKTIYLRRECKGFMHSCKKRNYGRVVETFINDDNPNNIKYEIKKRVYDTPVKTVLDWYRDNRKIIKLLSYNSWDVMLVKYEDLSLDLKRELRRICAFIGVEYEDSMLNFSEVLHHNIGGNPTRMFKSNKIKYDDGWKRGLTKFEKFIADYTDTRIIRLLREHFETR